MFPDGYIVHMHSGSSTPSLFDDAGSGVLSITELTGGLRRLVEAEYGDVWVEGELSNFKRYGSGHCYFTLKDDDAQIRGVMWRHFTQYVFFQPRDGMLVQAHGHVSVYEARGEMQLVVRSMRLAGEGARQQAFEALKRQLYAEGLFEAEYKRPLPAFPERIGIVTSGSGAVLHDLLSILKRRFPSVHVLVCPVRVQGMGAAEAVAEAVDAFNAIPEGDPLRADVLIVGRGGGSVEDLWAFNEEVVARAIFRSEIPVISAVGHETDFTIADYVADVRAATPSMAAELAVPDRGEVLGIVRSLYGAIDAANRHRIAQARQQVARLTGSYAFRRPVDQMHRNAQRLDELTRRIHRASARQVERQQERLAALETRLQLLDPERPLRQGYARVERDGHFVRRRRELESDAVITLHFQDGKVEARVG